MYSEMALINLTPDWAKLLDYERRMPSFIEKLVAEKQLR